jgi:flagellar biosynthesis protein FlhF
MKVKRYIVDDLPEAVKMIRNELGSDAVILNTKDIRIGGFLGMFSKKRVEVIAAVDEASRNSPPRASLPIHRPQERPQEKQMTFEHEEVAVASASLPSNAIRERYSQAPFADSGRIKATDVQTTAPAAQAPIAAAQSTVFADQAPIAVAQSTAFADQAPIAAAQSTGTIAMAVRPKELREHKQPQDESSALMQELRSMKEMMTRMAKEQTISRLPEAVVKWSKRLTEQGVAPAYVEQFAEEVSQRLEELDEASDRTAYDVAQSVLLSWIQDIQGSGINKFTRIVHFVGPTGVGKTTTIAKLAAEQSFSHRRKVGLITADTYRIAAVDQLRTYADILNIPLEVVFSPSELIRAYQKLSDHDLLFMDTAGRNYRNELFVSEVNSLLSPGEQKETILVLSMTHKYSDMKLVTSQFAKYGVSQLLLTKFDETDSYGAILNLAKEFSFRISYITCGQTVPDDIRPFDPVDLVRLLLGDADDE